jgi:iron(III) transport system permease protein
MAEMRQPISLRLQLLGYLLLILLAALLIWPIISVLQSGFVDSEGPTLFYFNSVFGTEFLRNGFRNSFLLAVTVTAGCACIALPLAWIMINFDFPLKKWLSALVLVPMILPPFVGALGMRKLLAPSGGPLVLILQKLGLIAPNASVDLLAGSPFWATACLMLLYLYPIMFLNVQAAMANIDPTLEEAAQNLGAGRRRIFWRITLPLLMPGLFAGATIVFIWSFTELGTPLLVGFRDVAAVQIFDGLAQLDVNPQPYAQVAILLIASTTIYVIGKLILGRGGHAMTSRATIARNTRDLGWAGLPLTFLVGGLIMVAALPHLSVVLLSLAEKWQFSILPQDITLRYLGQVLDHPLTGHSIINSLKYASLATFLNIIIGIAIGYVIVRTNWRWRGTLDGLSMLPLAVPGLVMAFGFLSITRPGSPLAFMNPNLGDPMMLLVIAYAVRRLPYVVRSVVAGLQQTSVVLEEAAMNLGASRWKTVRKITLPLISANLIAGGLLAFSFAMLEVSDSLILAFKEQNYPITKAIYTLGARLGDGSQMACALGVVGLILLTITLVGASRLLGRRLGSLFRV